MEIIVDIVGLVVKINVAPTDGILTGILDESKTEVDKNVVSKIEVLIVEEHKIVEDVVFTADDCNSVAKEESGCSLIDEVEVTSIIDTLSYKGEKSDWTFELSEVVTIKLVEVVFELDIANGLFGE